jgi:D-glycero-D-manno-heptose 1,7-bisphosphate phosphatase
VIAKAGGRIDGIYLCPHAPEDHCTCRKPRPGLILQAAAELGLDLARSILIGDALSDLQAGQAADISRLILVRTGRGITQEQLPDRHTISHFETYNSLAEATAAVLAS